MIPPPPLSACAVIVVVIWPRGWSLVGIKYVGVKEQRAEAKAVADLVHIFHLLEAEKKATDTANTLREEKQKLQDLLAAAENKVNKLQKKSKSRKSKASKLKKKLATTKAEAMDNLEILGNEYEILLESKVNKL